MLRLNEAKSLFSNLCTELGFCLSPEACMRIQQELSEDINDFTNAVFTAEGLDPNTADRHLYRQVRAKIVEAFHKSEAIRRA